MLWGRKKRYQDWYSRPPSRVRNLRPVDHLYFCRDSIWPSFQALGLPVTSHSSHSSPLLWHPCEKLSSILMSKRCSKLTTCCWFLKVIFGENNRRPFTLIIWWLSCIWVSARNSERVYELTYAIVSRMNRRDFQAYLLHNSLLTNIRLKRRKLHQVGAKLIRDSVTDLPGLNFTKLGRYDVLPIWTPLFKRDAKNVGESNPDIVRLVKMFLAIFINIKSILNLM